MNAVVQHNPDSLPAETGEGATTMLSVISRAASDPSVDIEKLERLMAMKERMDAKAAETEFNAALARVQSNMGRVATDKTNEQTRSRYATYAALDRALRPIYTADGFSLSFGTEPAPEGMVGVVCYVSHGAGHTREYRAHVPSDGKGIKGNSMMTGTHAFGSGTSYGMRYLLKMIFNVAVGEDDDDGNAAGGKVDADALGEWRDAFADASTKDELEAYRVQVRKLEDPLRKNVIALFTARERELSA